MVYFVPGWYAENKWSEQETRWHDQRSHTEFDETVKHVQLFHRSSVAPYQITILSYAPNFRHFLHRQGVFRANYWSCFDAIAGIKRRKQAVFSLHDLKWPEGIRFLYTMFCVIAMVGNEKYAQLEFGEDGNLIEIILFQNNQIIRKNIYDDRGFVSSTMVYQDGLFHHQDYLSETGQWVLRQFSQDGHVECNPVHNYFWRDPSSSEETIPFRKSRYNALDEVIAEVFGDFVAHTAPEDIFCASVDARHNALLSRVLVGRKVIATMYEESYQLMNDLHARNLLSLAGCVVCDSQKNGNSLRSALPNLKNCQVIPPYDSRRDFGISQQISTQKILIPVDGLNLETAQWMLPILIDYLTQNDHGELVLFSRRVNIRMKEDYLQRVRAYTEQYCQQQGIEDSEALIDRVSYSQCVDELSVSRCLREQRIIVDFRNSNDPYLRVIALSMGIPQILAEESEFVESGKNGVVLKDRNQLVSCLVEYLDGPSLWNKAMVAAYEIGKRYSTKVQITKWKGVMDSFGADSHYPSGN